MSSEPKWTLVTLQDGAPRSKISHPDYPDRNIETDVAACDNSSMDWSLLVDIPNLKVIRSNRGKYLLIYVKNDD